jgi:hypothetical protein
MGCRREGVGLASGWSTSRATALDPLPHSTGCRARLLMLLSHRPPIPLPTPPPHRCPGITAQPLPTCSIWANDFAGTGLHPPCNSTPVLVTGPNNQYTLGTAVKYEGGARESLAFFFDWWVAREIIIGPPARTAPLAERS